ncbi:hypothetical protein OA492_01960 [Pelagibacteraceae bacterium]|nr:hypothetical protein [Pelagibacteraceae bacterium]
MKILLTLFVLLFPSFLFADDISDLEIEGISIGDNLLNYFSKDEIMNGIRDYGITGINKEFTQVEFWNNKNFRKYDVVSATIKYNQYLENYKVYDISGAILFRENINECYAEKERITIELSSFFPNLEIFDSGRQLHVTDKTNKSTYDRVDFLLESGDSAYIICYDWAKSMGNVDHLSIGLTTKEFNEWLSNQG